MLILERESSPRFSIGESLLLQCMEYLEEGGMLQSVIAAGFQVFEAVSFNHAGRHAPAPFHPVKSVIKNNFLRY